MKFMSNICTEAAGLRMRALRGRMRHVMATGAMLCAAVAAMPAMSAPASVEAFDKMTWPALVRTARQPSIVVFTSVTCTHCPGVIAHIARERAAKVSLVSLMVVSMDADDESALLRDAHYAPADRLFVFRGHPQALQFAVNRDWRGMTPYVAFIDGKGSAKFVLGEPGTTVLDGWLRAGR